MPRRFLFGTLLLFCLWSPAAAFADEVLLSAPEELPSITITTPSLSAYTRADKIFPKVAFASTSQILDVDYLLNGSSVSYDKPLPFFEQPLGTTTFSVVTRDIEGTVATTSVTFILTADSDTLAFDITESYKRGFITKAVIRDRFLRAVELFSDTKEKRDKILQSNDKKKEDRAEILSERMQKILDSDILDLLKKQEGRTVTRFGAARIREDIEALRRDAGV